jgi:hypothetical protein
MDWSYVAGYFDGEGTAWCSPHGAGSPKCSLSWSNTHLASLEALRNFIGSGTIRKHGRPKGHHKQCYELVIAKHSELVPVVEHLLDGCIIKHDALLALWARLSVMRPSTPAWGSLSRAGTEEVTRIYGLGWTQKRIGDHFGVTQAAVKNFLKRRGIPRRSRKEAQFAASRNSPAWSARNQKISEARKREWADPQFRRLRLAEMNSAEKQGKRVAARQASRASRGGRW